LWLKETVIMATDILDLKHCLRVLGIQDKTDCTQLSCIVKSLQTQILDRQYSLLLKLRKEFVTDQQDFQRLIEQDQERLQSVTQRLIGQEQECLQSVTPEQKRLLQSGEHT
jgi:hypothetical protein